MSVTKRPSFQFYPGDWLKDPAVRMSSPEAKGVWIDLICISDQMPHRGKFVRRDGVTPLTDEQILNMVGGFNAKNLAALKELEDNEVSKRDENGALYCGRIVRDQEERERFAANGKKGGRPKDTGYAKEPALSKPARIEQSSPAINYSTPEAIPYDREKPIPFGIGIDALESMDFDRIEAAISKRWKETKGVGQWLPTGSFTRGRADFEIRCRTEGWLSDAEKALALCPLAETLMQDTFLKAHTAQHINAMKFPYFKDRPAATVIEAKPIDPDHSRKKLAKDAADLKEKAERRAAYRGSLDAKWGAEAAILTEKDISALDQKFPEQGLYGRYLAAGKPRATDTQRKSYAITLHECLEMESGGKSFEQLEAGR